jgi:hypothetical protein
MLERAALAGRRRMLGLASATHFIMFHDQRLPFLPLCLYSIYVYLHIRLKKCFVSFKLLSRLAPRKVRREETGVRG